ncbi:hypothetical protein L2E82_14382 [Cichorium intybus]|uniref:Uncharacterized protein n=1 Tax=Cichorium intybus TaxID=13427 RepID=A0ACB9F0G9_CICIN|nr:hypothetical protein L2E82_14382 [Cichorium intybus]
MASRPSGMHAGFYRLHLTLFHRNFLFGTEATVLLLTMSLSLLMTTELFLSPELDGQNQRRRKGDSPVNTMANGTDGENSVEL